MALMSGTTALLQTPVGFLVDKHGARPFLVGGTLLMALSISAMAFAPGIWAIWLLAILSGVGNSVIHPADYAILAGSIDKTAWAAPSRCTPSPAISASRWRRRWSRVLAALMGWRGALLLVGLLGVPVVAAILVQSRILRDQAKPAKTGDEPERARGAALAPHPAVLRLLHAVRPWRGRASRPSSITVLGKLWGTPVAVASHGADRLHGGGDGRHAGGRLGGGPHASAT